LAHIGHFTTDLSSGEVTWTPQLYRIFGRNSDQFQPTVSAVRPLIHAGDLAGADLAVTEARNSGQAQRFHIRVVRPNEEIRYCLAIVEVESNSALPAQKIHGLVQDLTELRRAEEERRKLEQQVMQSQKLESLGVLAGGIAHDFNNLLTVIAGNLDLAQLKLGEEHPEVLSNLRDAATAAIRARDLTHQLLTFAKGGKPLIELVDAGPVVREAAALAMTGSQNRLECNIPEGLWPAWADAGQVSQVVGNLIINANHATSQPGTIFVEAANYHLEKVGAGGLSEGDWVRVTVRDQGTGIAPEILPKIFDPFFTTKSSGSGLGLSSAHSIVLAHGGIIDVHSEIGKGTRFSFYLPAETGRTTAVLNSRPSPVAARPLTVLVLEDEEPVRRMLVRVLNMLGHNATAAADGEAAVELVADAVKRGSGFNLAILDLTIPGGLGGHAALKRMLTVDPTIKAIATSGYADDPVMANFEAHGFKGRLAKPYRIADLKEAISRAVQ
jgi:signal transduction histidine kinase/ActR/RegA family two-component response regulator